MLARRNRLTRGVDYRHVVHAGVKCASPRAVVYIVRTGQDRPPRFGFIVSKRVGIAVVRNTVRRRLKAVCAHALSSVAAGSDVVVRALPRSADAAYDSLHRDVVRCLSRSGT